MRPELRVNSGNGGHDGQDHAHNNATQENDELLNTYRERGSTDPNVEIQTLQNNNPTAAQAQTKKAAMPKGIGAKLNIVA